MTQSETRAKLADFLLSCGHNGIHAVQQVTVTIKGVDYVAAKYRQHCTPPAGARNPEPYVQEVIYCVGALPKCYLKRKATCFTWQGDDREWFIAGYYPPIQRGRQIVTDPNFDQYHPCGHSFLIMPWPPEHGKIDDGERCTYDRVPMHINPPEVRPSQVSPR